MSNTFFHTAQQMQVQNQAFAMAFVVKRKVPSSGKPGDKAIIMADGTVEGWIGGGCTRGIVIKEAQEAIMDGKARLVVISKDGSHEVQTGVKSYPMTCQSGGSVEVYIEPILPKPHILIMGRSHVAMSLGKLAKAMEYTVSVVAADADEVTFPTADHFYGQAKQVEDALLPQTFIVVCTQGEQDELMLEAALRTDVPYVAFVSSRRKAGSIFKYLRDVNIPAERQQQVRTPAGLDIKAKLPEEVALSILAQIVEERRSEKEESVSYQPKVTLSDDIYINPVCDIPVQKSTAKHVIEHEGHNVYFCCDGCKITFEKDPGVYVEKIRERAGV